MKATALSYAAFDQDFAQDPALRDIEDQLVSILRGGWFVNVEHATQVTPRYTSWQRWGDTFGASMDPHDVVNAIERCRASHPKDIVRVHAQRFDPQTSFVMWV